MQTQRAAKLRQYAEEIDEADERLAAARSSKAEIMRRALDEGFKKKPLMKVLKDRRISDTELADERALEAEYREALGMTPLEALIDQARDEEAIIGGSDGSGSDKLAQNLDVPKARGRRKATAPGPVLVQ